MTKRDSDDTKIAVINNNIGFIQKDISEIKTVLKDNYATKESFETYIRESNDKFLKLENSNNFWKWFSPTLAAVLGSILTFLLIQYLMKI